MSNINEFERKLNRKHNEIFLFELGKAQEDSILAELEAAKKQFAGQKVPESFIENFERTMAIISKEEEQRENEIGQRNKARKRKINLTRVAVIILVFMGISGSMTFVVEAFRVRFFNLLFNDQGTYTELIVSEVDGVERPTNIKNYYYPTYITAGYKLESHSKNEIREKYYFDKNGSKIRINIWFNDDSSLLSQFDSENVDIEEIMVNQNAAMYVDNEGLITIAWIENEMLYKISGEVTIEEILKISESITYFDS